MEVDYGDVDLNVADVRPGKAIRTVIGKHNVPMLEGVQQHPWIDACHLDGEGNGPCFDARWVEANEAEETDD